MSSSDSEYHPACHQNQKVWDEMARKRKRFARPAQEADFVNPLATLDAAGWLEGDVRGKRLLCLAAGGGKQGVLYASAGAEVTVVDISPAMLDLDREIASQRRLQLRTLEASMDRMPMLADASFDIVIHPVSTCYVPRIHPVFREVARVLVDQGLYISQHKQPVSLQSSLHPDASGKYVIQEEYYRSSALPPAAESRLRESGAVEFLHRWEEMLGGLCRAGFVIEDLVEPVHADNEAAVGEFGHRARFIAPYVRIKARRKSRTNTPASRPTAIWLPQ